MTSDYKRREEVMFRRLIEFSVRRPGRVLTVIAIALLVSMSQYMKIKVDTDPENMLSKDEFVRVFHNDIKKIDSK